MILDSRRGERGVREDGGDGKIFIVDEDSSDNDGGVVGQKFRARFSNVKALVGH